MSEHRLPVAGAVIGGLFGLVVYAVGRALFGGSKKHREPQKETRMLTPHQYDYRHNGMSVDVVVTPVYAHPLDDPNHPFHPENLENEQTVRRREQADYARRAAFMRTPEHQRKMAEICASFDAAVAKRLAKEEKKAERKQKRKGWFEK
jgi:hypothetical protein